MDLSRYTSDRKQTLKMDSGSAAKGLVGFRALGALGILEAFPFFAVGAFDLWGNFSASVEVQNVRL